MIHHIYKSEALANVSKVLIGSGREERALEIVKSISSDWEKSEALSNILKVLIENFSSGKRVKARSQSIDRRTAR